jgi:hypothetical protein
MVRGRVRGGSAVAIRGQSEPFFVSFVFFVVKSLPEKPAGILVSWCLGG